MSEHDWVKTMQENLKHIPVATWRWLGVNDVSVPQNVSADADEKNIVAEAGETKQIVVVHRESAAENIKATVKDGAALELVCVQLGGETSARSIVASVGRDAVFKCTLVETGAKSASTLLAELDGDGAKADVWSLYFADETDRLDMNYIIRQKGKNTDAVMEVRGVLAGKSEKIFRGTLDFLAGAKNSSGRENEEVIVLSDETRNRSVPLMLSHEDDVDGHHAVSAGKIDEAKLFYLMSRGLSPAEAKTLLVEAALSPVTDRIADGSLRDEVKAAIFSRLYYEQEHS